MQFGNAVQKAELRVITAVNRLQLLLGRPVPVPGFDVAGPLRDDSPSMTLEQIRAQALDQRPDLLALRKGRDRTQADVRLQQANGRIDYTVGTAYQHQYTYSNGRLFGAYFSIPLPVHDRNRGEIARAAYEGTRPSCG